MLQPELPGVLRNAFVYALAKFHAVHHARAGFHLFAGCRCWTTRFVRHALLLTRVLPSHLTATSRKFLVASSLSKSVRASPIVSKAPQLTIHDRNMEIVGTTRVES